MPKCAALATDNGQDSNAKYVDNCKEFTFYMLEMFPVKNLLGNNDNRKMLEMFSAIDKRFADRLGSEGFRKEKSLLGDEFDYIRAREAIVVVVKKDILQCEGIAKSGTISAVKEMLRDTSHDFGFTVVTKTQKRSLVPKSMKKSSVAENSNSGYEL